LFQFLIGRIARQKCMVGVLIDLIVSIPHR